MSREEIPTILDRYGRESPSALGGSLPIEFEYSYGDVGGAPASSGDLMSVRGAVLELAREHGFPDQLTSLRAFEFRCAQLLHIELDITAHEASVPEVWCGVTAGHLLDVAVWRWGGISDPRRIDGDVNRDTFRRLWWRQEVFAWPADAIERSLLEDEYVAVMERPFVTGNPAVARMIANTFVEGLDTHDDVPRTLLMRELMKRITRLTPLSILETLQPAALAAKIQMELRAAAVGLHAGARPIG